MRPTFFEELVSENEKQKLEIEYLKGRVSSLVDKIEKLHEEYKRITKPSVSLGTWEVEKSFDTISQTTLSKVEWIPPEKHFLILDSSYIKGSLTEEKTPLIYQEVTRHVEELFTNRLLPKLRFSYAKLFS